MNTAFFSTAAAALLAATATSAFAQVQPQYPQLQAQPAATQASVINLDNRIVALERQLADLLRAEEENGRKLGQLEATLQQEREASTSRIAALEARLASASTASVTAAAEPASRKAEGGGRQCILQAQGDRCRGVLGRRDRPRRRGL